MQEIELKFLIPPAQLTKIVQKLNVKSAKKTQMAAHYFDTQNNALAKRGIGLRIRREGDNWVQTLKAGGDGIAARLEHNQLLDNEHVQRLLDTQSLQPDLTIYKGTSIASALSGISLDKIVNHLIMQYVTSVQRTTRLLTDENNSYCDNSNENNFAVNNQDNGEANNVIEVAYDDGEVIHGTDDSLRQPIQEIEFELISGDIDYLFSVATTWCKRYKLCLSTVTKAERGGLLIQGRSHSPAVSANLNQWTVKRTISKPAFIRAVAHNCLLQILPNSSAIVAGGQDIEHVRQLRIGICRLQAALKAFKQYSDELNPEWLPILAQATTLLDSSYERAALILQVENELQNHGGPLVDWGNYAAKRQVMPFKVIAATDFQLTLLALIAFTMSDPRLEKGMDTAIGEVMMTKILSETYKKMVKAEDLLNDSWHDEIDITRREDAQYAFQRRIENLRYISEFAAPLYAKKKTKPWLKRTTKAQLAVEQYHTDMKYQQYYQQRAATDLNAWFGVGWFASNIEKKHKQYHKQLCKLRKTPVFW